MKVYYISMFNDAKLLQNIPIFVLFHYQAMLMAAWILHLNDDTNLLKVFFRDPYKIP